MLHNRTNTLLSEHIKKVSQLLKLKGQLEHISVSEFRANPGEIFQQVEAGKVFVIEKNGKVIAQICPAKPVAFVEPSSDDVKRVPHYEALKDGE